MVSREAWYTLVVVIIVIPLFVLSGAHVMSSAGSISAAPAKKIKDPLDLLGTGRVIPNVSPMIGRGMTAHLTGSGSLTPGNADLVSVCSVDLTGERDGSRVRILGGNVTGSLTWNRVPYPQGTNLSGTGGKVEGTGRVEVLDTQGSLIGEISLPSNETQIFENASTIRLYAEAAFPRPDNGSWSGEPVNYSADVTASILWQPY